MQTIQDGEWPNIAITPGTDKHAATGERVKRPSDHGSYEARRATEWTKADMSENCGDSARDGCEMSKIDTREKLEADALNLVYNLRSYGWKYAGDPEREINELLDRQAALTERECIGTLTAEQFDSLRDNTILKLQAEVDELEVERDEWKAKAEESERAMNKAAGNWAKADADKRELNEANEYHKLQYEAACEDADRLREVARTQAESFRKLEAEIRQLTDDRDHYIELFHEQEDRASRLEDGRELSVLRATVFNQREELARLNEQMRGKRQIPKKVKWPRFADGKLVKIGRDCEFVELFKNGYELWASDCAAEPFGAKYGEPVPYTWRESEWRQ